MKKEKKTYIVYETRNIGIRIILELSSDQSGGQRLSYKIRFEIIAGYICGISYVTEGDGFFTLRPFRFRFADHVKTTEASREPQKPHVKGIIAKTTGAWE